MTNDYNGVDTSGSANSQSIDTNWFGEAWRLFVANLAIWIPAVAITFYGPLSIDLYLLIVTRGMNKIGATVEHPTAFVVGVALLNAIFIVFMLNGLGNLAVRQVSGAHTVFSDVFSGSRNFAGTLLWFLLVGSVLIIATSLVVVPGILVASLLIPTFALVTSGENLIVSINRSINASKSDRLNARVVAFLLGLLLFLGFATLGLALLVSLPIVLLVSALAYRDLIGLHGRAPGAGFLEDNIPDIAFKEPKDHAGPRRTLTGNDLDDPGSSA